MTSLKVIVADDHALMRSAVRSALERADGLEIVGEAETGHGVLALARSTEADVVLLDIRMPGTDGFQCLDVLRQRHPDLKVVMFTALDDPATISKAMNGGASGYVMKSVDPSELASVLRQICAGNVFRAVTDSAPSGGAGAVFGLTGKECDVLGALARGLTNRAIAKEFWLAEQTVKFHLTNIYRKLGVHSRTEATRYAYEKGLVRSPVFENA
jgi:DNA-binding NarL/FixJ family response regulator